MQIAGMPCALQPCSAGRHECLPASQPGRAASSIALMWQHRSRLIAATFSPCGAEERVSRYTQPAKQSPCQLSGPACAPPAPWLAQMGGIGLGWRACWLAHSRCSSACCTQSRSPARQGSTHKYCPWWQCGGICAAWTSLPRLQFRMPSELAWLAACTARLLSASSFPCSAHPGLADAKESVAVVFHTYIVRFKAMGVYKAEWQWLPYWPLPVLSQQWTCHLLWQEHSPVLLWYGGNDLHKLGSS